MVNQRKPVESAPAGHNLPFTDPGRCQSRRAFAAPYLFFSAAACKKPVSEAELDAVWARLRDQFAASGAGRWPWLMERPALWAVGGNRYG
jgi:hypothetical protein